MYNEDDYKILDDNSFESHYDARTEDTTNRQKAYENLKARGWVFAVEKGCLNLYGMLNKKNKVFVFYSGSLDSCELYICTRSLDSNYSPLIKIEDINDISTIFAADFNSCLYHHIRADLTPEFFAPYGYGIRGQIPDEVENAYEQAVLKQYNEFKKKVSEE